MSCIYDPQKARADALARTCIPDREAFLALDYKAFDQSFETPSPENPTAGGWRGVAREELCVWAAANLIGDWREENAEGAARGHEPILFWHEGQLRAGLGQVNAATALFGQARRPVTSVYDEAWNAYADATIAFMLKDRARLDAVHSRMKALPEPADWAQRTGERVRWAKANNVTFPPARWPQNITVVERLIACFDSSYRDAYRGACPANADG